MSHTNATDYAVQYFKRELSKLDAELASLTNSTPSTTTHDGAKPEDVQPDDAERKDSHGWIVLGAVTTVVLALVGLAILRRR